MSDTAKRLKEAIEKAGIKQVELCEKTGISKGALSSYLSGRYEPKQNNIYALAKALGVNPAWLMGLEVPMYEIKIDVQPPISTFETRIIAYFKMLNKEGREEALKRVAELTELEKYKE